jgi:hypothetical protein
LSAADEPPARSPQAEPGAHQGRRTEFRLPGLESPTARRAAFVAAEIAAVVAMVLLAFVGFNRVLNSRDGRLADGAPGPGDPNFEQRVARTPVALVFGLDASGELSSLVILSLTSPTVGSVMFLPPATAVTDQSAQSTDGASSGTTTTTAAETVPNSTVAAIFKKRGVNQAERAVAEVVNTSFTDVVTVPHDRMVQLLQPLAPLTIDNPDALDVKDGKGQKVASFPTGKLSLSAADAVTYLEVRDPKLSDSARLVRQIILWKAWLAAVAASKDANAVPGETNTGLGRYVRTIAPLQQRMTSLPTTPRKLGSGEVFDPQKDAIKAGVSVMVPYPTSSVPGARLKVRLLNGAVDPADSDELIAKVAALLVPENAEIDTIGNADSFDKETTQIIAHLPETHIAASFLRDSLKFGEVVDAAVPSDAQDVTVIIGRDLAESLP